MRILTTILLFIAMAGPIASQTILSVTHGTTANGVFGTAMGPGPDWNGDGVPDVLAGAPEDPTFQDIAPPGTPSAPSPGNGRVEVISGATGAILFTIPGPFLFGRYGTSFAALGDVNGDGQGDFAVGAPNVYNGDGDVEVLSGVTLLPLYSFTLSAFGPPNLPCGGTGLNDDAEFGHAMAAGGDLTGDGIPDLWVGAPFGFWSNNQGPSRIEVHSGVDGSIVVGACSIPSAFFFDYGWSVAEPEDVNGDGALDIIGTTYGQARVKIYSGVDGSLLNNVQVVDTSYAYACALLPDQDGDGIRDLAVSAPFSSMGGLMNAGRVVIQSGANLAILGNLFGQTTGDVFGYALDASGDFDGDGVKDLAVGATAVASGNPGPGYVEVYSGATLQLLAHVDSPVTGNLFGYSLAFVGDLDGDGRDELAVGAPTEPHNGMMLAGAVYLIGGLEPPPGVGGNVGLFAAFPETILTVNGSAGGASLRVPVGLGQPFSIGMGQPSTLATPAGFSLFAAVGLPSSATVYPTLFGNFSITPQPAAPANPLLFHIADSLGFGNPVIAATPAPWSVAVPSGLPQPLLVTFQGLIEHMPVPFPGNLAITNAVILDVR